MNIYVDGCSYTAGHGLAPQYSLAKLIQAQGHSVTDLSVTGKSNYSMALDLHQAPVHDFYVIGWTFASRMEYQLDDRTVFSSAIMTNIGMGDHPAGGYLECEYRELNSRFFKYVSRFDQFSDFVIDAAAALIGDNRFCFFSWEKRNTKTDVLYPVFDHTQRQAHPKWQQWGHLNEAGMIQLSKLVLKNLPETKQ